MTMLNLRACRFRGSWTYLAGVLAACGSSADANMAANSAELEKQRSGSYAADVATSLTIPVTGTAAWRHFYDDRAQGNGVAATAFSVAFGTSGAQVTADLTTSAGSFERQFFSSSGLQPATDTFISPFSVMLDMLPNRNSTPVAGQTWASAFPQAWLDKISASAASGVPDTHLEREVKLSDVFSVQNGALKVVRVTFSEHSTLSPTQDQMDQGAQPGRQMRTAIGVADVIIGVTGPFAGRMLPVRVASVSHAPVTDIEDDETYESVVAGPHTSDVDCATAVSQLDAASLLVVPTGGQVAPPSDYAMCSSVVASAQGAGHE